jgi:hypothetical protein
MIGSDGSPCRASVATARPDDPRGHATMELHYSIKGLRGYARALYAHDVEFYAACAASKDEDEYDALARMAIDPSSTRTRWPAFAMLRVRGSTPTKS